MHHKLPSSIEVHIPIFSTNIQSHKPPRFGMIQCNKFVNTPAREADVNTFCNSRCDINTIISYHLCEITSKFSVFVQMSPHFLLFIYREVHLYLVQCILFKRSELWSQSRMQPARSRSFPIPHVNNTCCRNSRIIIVASFLTNLLSP